MRVAIVENTRHTHHGQIGVALSEAGHLWDVYRPYSGDGLPEASDYAALVVFGGEQAATDDAVYPYLPTLASRMRAFGEAGRAVLGICLGAQLLARGYGARNHLGTAPEIGWCRLQSTKAGRSDPVMAAAPAEFPIFQWHSDTFDLPNGAVHLATGAGAAQQAFRIGEKVYGTQFHFEANCAVVADWARLFPAQIEHMAPGWLDLHADHAAEHGAQADEAGLALARAWVACI